MAMKKSSLNWAEPVGDGNPLCFGSKHEGL